MENQGRLDSMVPLQIQLPKKFPFTYILAIIISILEKGDQYKLNTYIFYTPFRFIGN